MDEGGEGGVAADEEVGEAGEAFFGKRVERKAHDLAEIVIDGLAFPTGFLDRVVVDFGEQSIGVKTVVRSFGKEAGEGGGEVMVSGPDRPDKGESGEVSPGLAEIKNMDIGEDGLHADVADEDAGVVLSEHYGGVGRKDSGFRNDAVGFFEDELGKSVAGEGAGVEGQVSDLVEGDFAEEPDAFDRAVGADADAVGDLPPGA